jgi:Poly(3-hydroxyalkanoate) synthetase
MMMRKTPYTNNSAAGPGELVKENLDRALDNSQKWAEILLNNPCPQTGLTPHETVWRKNKAKLYRYVSKTGIRYGTPVLFVYALINKAYILDLTPGMSLIEYLVDQGYDVYLLDWGDFGWEDRQLGFSDLICDYLSRAVAKTCQFSGCREISIIGYCMGGTMAAMYASLFSSPRTRNLVFLAAPFDFDNVGLSSQWLKSEFYDVDKIVDAFELIPRHFIDTGLKMLNPVNNFFGTYSRLWKMIDEGLSVHNWQVLNKWMNDNTNLPGEIFRQWVRDMYQENKLVKKQFVLRGHTVDLSRIEASLLVLTGINDHIVLPGQTTAILGLSSSSDQNYVEFPVGHGGLVFGSTAKNNVYPGLHEWLKERSM